MFGTPLPAALSGNTVQRLIEVDQALLYLVTGALEYLLDYEPLDQTGALTVENARNALSDMFYTYLDDTFTVTPIGASMIWHMDTPPPRWLFADGSGVLKATYPELYDLFGGKYGESTDFFGLPDFTSRVPYGADFTIELDDEAGEATHTLTTPEIPSHTHDIWRLTGGSAGANPTLIANVVNLSNTPGIFATRPTGGGGAHNNIQPVLGVKFIIYAGH